MKSRWRRVVDHEEIPESEFLMAKAWAALGLSEPSRSGPCWCNRGPGRDETHHPFCRKRRARWKTGLRALKKMGEFEEEGG